MSQVLCRFSLVSIERTRHYGAEPHSEAARVKFAAVQGEPFGSATPQGSIDMLIVNEAAAAVLHEARIGQEFDVLFTPRAAVMPHKKG